MESLHETLLTTKSLLHVSTTGAGLRLQTALWDPPGASAYLVGFFTPYARTQLHSFLGHAPGASYCSDEVALDLAMASYLRAAEHRVITGASGEPVGVGVTAAVASTRVPRGEQRAHVVIITAEQINHFEVPLVKATGYQAREEHDKSIAQAVLGELQRTLTKTVESSESHCQAAMERFYRNPVFDTNGRRYPASVSPGVYLPATLNPIHDGHRMMCRVAEELMHSAPGGARFVRYLVSSTSPHKGRLSVQGMLKKAGMLRAERWRDESRIVEFTHDEPLFLDKARKRPGSIFLIGADTMARMLDPRWGPDVSEMLSEMRNLETRFWVMGRKVGERYVTCRDVAVPPPHQKLFEPMEGRLDVSSTELRAAGAT